MRNFMLTQAMNLYEPYRICGDANTIIELSDEAAAFARQQGYGTLYGDAALPSYEEIVPPPEPVGTLQKMNFENVSPPLPDDPVVHEPSSHPDAEDSPIQRALDNVPEPEPATLKKPDGRNTQKVWAAWAVANDPDLTIERAEGMSKQDLMSQYGGRW